MSVQDCQIRIKLRDAIEAYRVRTGVRLTYASLAQTTGLSEATLQSLAARPNYNARLSTVALLCQALECGIADLLELTGAAE